MPGRAASPGKSGDGDAASTWPGGGPRGGDAAGRDPPRSEAGPQAPGGMDRRSFVKGAIAGAALGAGLAAGFGFLKQVAPLETYRVRYVPYVGFPQGEGSPAPRGLPLVPIEVDAEGFVRGVPERDGTNYLDWYRYCGHVEDPGLQPDHVSDNRFEYFLTEDKMVNAGGQAGELYWYLDRLGSKVRAEDFAGLPAGSGAAVRWRSEGATSAQVITALLIKVDRDALRGGAAEAALPLMAAEHGLVAVSTFCPHFCCVPGFKEAGEARARGFWDWIYCTCHGSRFDVTRVEEFEFELRERVA